MSQIWFSAVSVQKRSQSQDWGFVVLDFGMFFQYSLHTPQKKNLEVAGAEAELLGETDENSWIASAGASIGFSTWSVVVALEATVVVYCRHVKNLTDTLGYLSFIYVSTVTVLGSFAGGVWRIVYLLRENFVPLLCSGTCLPLIPVACQCFLDSLMSPLRNECHST